MTWSDVAEVEVEVEEPEFTYLTDTVDISTTGSIVSSVSAVSELTVVSTKQIQIVLLCYTPKKISIMNIITLSQRFPGCIFENLHTIDTYSLINKQQGLCSFLTEALFTPNTILTLTLLCVI